MGRSYGKLMKARAKKKHLADGQGAAKQKHTHRRRSPRHRRAFADLNRA